MKTLSQFITESNDDIQELMLFMTNDISFYNEYLKMIKAARAMEDESLETLIVVLDASSQAKNLINAYNKKLRAVRKIRLSRSEEKELTRSIAEKVMMDKDEYTTSELNKIK